MLGIGGSYKWDNYYPKLPREATGMKRKAKLDQEIDARVEVKFDTKVDMRVQAMFDALLPGFVEKPRAEILGTQSEILVTSWYRT